MKELLERRIANWFVDGGVASRILFVGRVAVSTFAPVVEQMKAGAQRPRNFDFAPLFHHPNGFVVGESIAVTQQTVNVGQVEALPWLPLFGADSGSGNRTSLKSKII